MEMIDASKYNVELRQEDGSTDEMQEYMRYLQNILLDLSIPEEHKQNVRKEMDEIIRLKSITMKPPTIVLTPK